MGDIATVTVHIKKIREKVNMTPPIHSILRPYGESDIGLRCKNMITSTSNQRVKQLLQLQKKSKARNQEKVFIAEGSRMVRETPRKLCKSCMYRKLTIISTGRNSENEKPAGGADGYGVCPYL